MLRGPPKAFDRTNLALIEVEPSTLLRLASRARASHLGFRRSARYRFDAPAAEFGVLYAAFDLATAFAETVLRTVPQETPAGEEPLLTYEELSRRRVVHLAPVARGRPLRLIKLYDEGLAAAKVDNRIATVDDYATTRIWPRRFGATRSKRTASCICPGSWVVDDRWCCSIGAHRKSGGWV